MAVPSVIVSFLVVISGCYCYIDVGKHFKTCDRNALDVNECLVEAVRHGIAIMTGGIKELNVPPVDPYHQQELRVEYNNYQIFAKMSMKDIYVQGLKQAKVKNARLRADEDRFHMEVDLVSPTIFVNGTYSGQGSYNALKINATGVFNTTMHHVVYTWKLDGRPEKKDNETYIRIYDFYMRPDVGSLQSYITDDNPDSKPIIDLANNFANANWKPLYREFLPFAQDNWKKIGIRVANRIFLKIPYDQLFPADL